MCGNVPNMSPSPINRGQFNTDTEFWYDKLIAMLEQDQFKNLPGPIAFREYIIKKDKNKNPKSQEDAIKRIMSYSTGLFGNTLGSLIKKNAWKVYANEYADEFKNQYGPSSAASEFISIFRQALTYNMTEMKKSDVISMIREEIKSALYEKLRPFDNTITEDDPTAPVPPNTQFYAPDTTNNGQQQPRQDPRLVKMNNDMDKLSKTLERLNAQKAPIEKRIATVNQAKGQLQKRIDDTTKTIERNNKTM